ncbi:MAG: pyruvate kinase [Phycisphaerales bacterium]|nr:pyruvate kinase [Phycisphaerales bacterium]
MTTAAPADLPVRSERPSLTKVLATLGPASDSPETITKLVQAGVSLFRLNFSHGSLEDHARRLDAVRMVARTLRRPLAVLGDLQGPKIRVGLMPKGGLDISTGSTVALRLGVPEGFVETDGAGEPRVVLPFEYEPLAREVLPGHRVLINDGSIRMLAVERDPDRGELVCRVTSGGLVTTRKGINLPDSDLSAPAITERDWECVEWAVAHGVDLLALSFVRQAAEVLELKQRLAGMCPISPDEKDDELGSTIPVVAKIEKPQALEAIDEIVQAADAIMVARGDLGVEMDIARVPIAQKAIIKSCSRFGKPCIVATQMLESMIESPMPTRAEATDVANAVLDGAGCLMLSAETATGKHPVLVVDTMRRIALAAEDHLASLPASPSAPQQLQQERYRTAALAHGAWHIANDVGAELIVCWSQAGGGARYLSQNDFRVPIIAYTSSIKAARRMALLRGVTAIRAEPPPSGRLSDWNEMVDRDLVTRGWAEHGTPIVLVAGKPLGKSKVTTSVAVHYVGYYTGFRTHDV